MAERIAVLVENDFHDIEFWYPFYRLQEAGYEPIIVAPAAPKVYRGKYGTTVEAPYDAGSVAAQSPAGVVIPGGWAPDRLRMSAEIVGLVRGTYESGGFVAGICHAGSLLVSCGILAGKRVTSYPSLRDDMILAGAEWVDAEVVVSDRIITSRRPSDLPAFMAEVMKALAT
ncbi:MAG TPA: type 1 glutamine amidotransferase domain-containing protein [Synergistales bacterium]|jgi:protease I|nr:type 1 glutamine amidotransferase domain-containing protein [Synergistales bacterium]HOR54707.1 type 1 glutamine amidotransferase domain-containing protein [Synergistales bacterium]